MGHKSLVMFLHKKVKRDISDKSYNNKCKDDKKADCNQGTIA